MLIFDDTTIAISAVLLLTSVLSSFLNPFFRKVKISESPVAGESTKEESSRALPPVSIIFTPHDNVEELSRNLPGYLNQQYPADIQVIVVAPQKDNETADILKRYADNPRLYTTFIPESSRYMSRKKLAITLGVKAARNEWVMMADICCTPPSDRWLESLARNCTSDKDLIIGYTRYDEDTPDYMRFERFYHTFHLMREDQQGHAYRCASNALLFRKSRFLSEEGFRGNLKYIRGEYDFMVNKYFNGHNLILENSPEGTLTEQTPTGKAWCERHLFYMESRQHLERTFKHRMLPYLDQAALHFNYILQCTAVILSVILQHWIITAAAFLSLLITMVLRTYICKKALTRFSVALPTWKILPYEAAIGWHHIGYRIKYEKANKYDFISHKL
ncbi:MAG: glycosyltransferase [Prevotella sp.]|nr:glycosyltransferase [Prevotella sp.]